jgi:SAM-dependent methyltransferase
MAILLHATRATHDIPHIGVCKGDRMYHVVSDLPGRQGSEELRTFVRGCGMRPEWVQYRGSYREHFDAHGPLVECLRVRGARLVSNHELGLLLRTKRDLERHALVVPPSPPPYFAIDGHDGVTQYDEAGAFRWGPVTGVPSEEALHALGDVAGREVLEIGCGLGSRALAVVRWGAHYTGLDEDSQRIDAVRRRLARAGADGRVVHGSPQDLAPLADASYEVVFNAVGEFAFVPHLPLALAAIARVLRPGGRCALMVVSPFFDGFPLGAEGAPSLYPVRSYFDRTPRHESGIRRLRFHRTVGDWLAAFAQAGLIVIDALELEPHPREWQPGLGSAQPHWEQLAMLPYTMIWRAYKPA